MINVQTTLNTKLSTTPSTSPSTRPTRALSTALNRKRRTKPSVMRLPGRVGGFLLLSIPAMTLAFLGFVSLIGLMGLVLSPSVLANTTAQSSAVKRLDVQINRWSEAQFGQKGAYTFATQDRRLQVPSCQTFSFSSNVSATEPKSAFMVNVACAEVGWSRFIRAKATEQVVIEAALVDVLTPIAIIEAGKSVSAKDFTVRQLPPHRTPQGAIAKLDTSSRWFSARRMRPGYIVTSKDLRQPRRVLVVNKALPAGTLLTKQSFDVEERAVNIPRDAITSMENIANLAASKLLHPGDILRRRDLTKGKLIKRGEKVALLSQGLSYAISSEVVALEDGFLGEQVRLLNPESQRRISAIVTGASRAKTLSTKL